MNPHGFDLDQLRSTWKDPAASTQVPDAAALADLRQEVAAGTRRLRREVAVEVAGAVLGAALFFWLAANALGSSALAYLTIGVFALVGEAWALHLRRTLWRAHAETPADFLQLQLRRSRVRGRLAALAAISGPAGVAVGFAMQSLAPAEAASRLFDRLSLAGVVILLAGFAALLVYSLQTWRSERRRQDRLERQLADLEV